MEEFKYMEMKDFTKIRKYMEEKDLQQMLKKNERIQRRWTEYRKDGEEGNLDSFKNNKWKVETRKAHKKFESKRMRI